MNKKIEKFSIRAEMIEDKMCDVVKLQRRGYAPIRIRIDEHTMPHTIYAARIENLIPSRYQECNRGLYSSTEQVEWIDDGSKRFSLYEHETYQSPPNQFFTRFEVRNDGQYTFVINDDNTVTEVCDG